MGLILLLLMMIVLTAANYLFNRLQRDYNDRLSIAVASTISESISRVSFSGKFHTRMLVNDMKARVKELAYISVEGTDNRVFAHSNPKLNDTLINQNSQEENQVCLTAITPIVAEKGLGELTVNEVIIPFSGGVDDEVMGIVRVGINLSDVRKSQSENFFKLILLIVVLTLISILIAYKLSRYFGRSIRFLANQLQGILDHAPIGLIISDPDGSVTITSRETAALFPAAGSAGNADALYQSLVDSCIAEKLRELDRKAFCGEGYIETELEISPAGDKSVFWQISKFPIARNDKGENTLICSFFRDTTEKHAAESSLKESEETFRRIFDNSSDAIMLLKEGRFFECNKSTLRLLGEIPREKLLGKTPADISPELQPDGTNSAEISERMIAEASASGYRRFEWEYQRADGSRFFADVAMTPITIKGSTMIHLTWRDITGYKLAEQEKEKLHQQLLQSQKMDAVGQLAGGVAHDFNNLLAGMMGAAEIMLKLDPCAEKRTACLEMILSAGSKAAELTSKLLTFARKREKVSLPLDISRVVRNALEIFERTLDKNINIQFSNLAESLVVMGDETMLQTVFMNLGINASHAMPEGGHLDFLLRNVKLDESYCRMNSFDLRPGTFVEIEVRDTGCGMSLAIQKRIFEPFFTTKDHGKGTGLGLAVAYGIIKDHGGAINVYSEEGVGTVFHVYLPVAEIALAGKIEEEAAVTGTGRILLVDDEQFIRETAKTLLESIGYSVVTASDGQEAVEIFKQGPDQVDLVILDMIMPVMGGRETLSRLREIRPELKVLVSSGFSKESEKPDFERQGISGFIRKPFRLAELSRQVARLLNPQ